MKGRPLTLFLLTTMILTGLYLWRLSRRRPLFPATQAPPGEGPFNKSGVLPPLGLGTPDLGVPVPDVGKYLPQLETWGKKGEGYFPKAGKYTPAGPPLPMPRRVP